ncbi:MAG TPA: hypothetical protein VGX96_05065 [Candidatus Elarobacter sp.]|jgi:hypothetical protein|nr:hypothetical protein [Candidatus Elarobacter sp.]
MMTNAAAAPDPIAAATAIAEAARRRAARTDDRTGTAAVAALASGVVLSLIAIGVMVSSPALIPMWCAAHGGCP